MTAPWVSGFLDLASSAYDDGVAFWRDVTGYGVSESRGEHGEFATLLPPAGDAHLRVQRLGHGPSRIHLDLHVTDPRAAADRAVSLGAREVADHGYVVLVSPGGFPFCTVSQPASSPTAPAEWPGGQRSMVDQVCLDIPEERYGEEAAFWQRLTGRERTPSPGHPEFERLHRPDGQSLHLLLQRLGERTVPVRAHLDVACSDRPAETQRHSGLGASVVAHYPDWTVMADPAGSAYCLTDREPV